MKHRTCVMGFLILPLFFMVFFAESASAHVPVLQEEPVQGETIPIEMPGRSTAYYGELKRHPHTYEFTTNEPMELFVQVLEPYVESANNDTTAIVARKVERGVEILEHIKKEDEAWETSYEFFGGDTYYEGPQFEAAVGPGTYQIQVSAPANVGKYVLVVGKREDFEGVGYFELLGRLVGVKHFFEKPGIAVVQSPFVFVPLGFLLLISGGYWWYRKRKTIGQSSV